MYQHLVDNMQYDTICLPAKIILESYPFFKHPLHYMILVSRQFHHEDIAISCFENSTKTIKDILIDHDVTIDDIDSFYVLWGGVGRKINETTVLIERK